VDFISIKDGPLCLLRDRVLHEAAVCRLPGTATYSAGRALLVLLWLPGTVMYSVGRRCRFFYGCPEGELILWERALAVWVCRTPVFPWVALYVVFISCVGFCNWFDK